MYIIIAYHSYIVCISKFVFCKNENHRHIHSKMIKLTFKYMWYIQISLHVYSIYKQKAFNDHFLQNKNPTNQGTVGHMIGHHFSCLHGLKNLQCIRNLQKRPKRINGCCRDRSTPMGWVVVGRLSMKHERLFFVKA